MSSHGPTALIESRDPFDLWALPRLGALKSAWYAGSRAAKLPLAATYLLDWLFPNTLRRVLGTPRYQFAHVLAWLRNTRYRISDESLLDRLEAMQRDGAWGLPFAWYSINFVYPPYTPLITSTPYVMEALLNIARAHPNQLRASEMFNDTWGFLEQLRVRVDEPDLFAVSYAPAEEAFTVVNANSYAAWAFAMHAKHGRPERCEAATDRTRRLVTWVLKQQNADGSWYYLAERGPWDMIDGFHSCFVVRNLRHVSALLPDLVPAIDAPTRAGWRYIRKNIFDSEVGLCRRYTLRHRPDPFRYDLYDQAEYLGLLIDFGELDEAEDFSRRVEARFRRGSDWYSRVDVLGRLWGRNFTRWGIAPFFHHRARLQQALSQEAA